MIVTASIEYFKKALKKSKTETAKGGARKGGAGKGGAGKKK